MIKFLRKWFLLIIILTINNQLIYSQKKNNGDSSLKFKTISAGPQYKRNTWHRFLWGKNYRKEWAKLIKVPVFLLKDNKGGLKPVKEGGGHQTTSLHLENKDGDAYTLRSVDKKLGKVLPKPFLGTFIEYQVNDEVSMSNPYAALTVPIMAESAGIYHTNPEIVYLPRQDALDSFNKKYAGKLYLFEQRLKGDWRDADNLGDFKKYYSTEDVLKKIQDKSTNKVDQKAFVKARLFDMFLGDWDRHEEQWGWGVDKTDSNNMYEPVPQDRDQVYFKHNGTLLDAFIYISGIGYFQSFKDHISDVTTMNYEERGIDRVFSNELKKQDWEDIAKELQQALTDNVIESAIKKFPPEIYKISGKLIVKDLKARRDLLLKYATQYYLFLAKEVEITGTKNSDYFFINRLSDSATEVKIFNVNKEDIKDSSPYYSRIFYGIETKEIRVFGIGGNDIYTADGNATKAIKLRIIGGYDKDSITINSPSNKEARTFVYDGHNDHIEGTNITQHLSNDSAIHKYEYKNYRYDVKGTNAIFLYSDEDRFFIGFSYGWKHFSWRRNPFNFNQNLSLHYSVTQNAISANYFIVYPNTLGKWDFGFHANYDFIRWNNFYGIGNETVLTTKNLDYNRMRTREFNSDISLFRKTGNNFFRIKGFVQTVDIVKDVDRYIAKNIAPLDSTSFNLKAFVGASVTYGFSKLNDAVTPTSGIIFSAKGSYTQSLSESTQSFWEFGSNLQLYVPLVYKFSLALSGGIQTISGKPEFYQYPEIGGGQDLRGFQRQRFYGKTAFYNSNELRFISNVRSYFFNGKAGLLAFVDDGRVWNPGESSTKLHIGYGGGILIAPFNFVSGEVTYGFSKEDKLLQVRINLPF